MWLSELSLRPIYAAFASGQSGRSVRLVYELATFRTSYGMRAPDGSDASEQE